VDEQPSASPNRNESDAEGDWLPIEQQRSESPEQTGHPQSRFKKILRWISRRPKYLVEKLNEYDGAVTAGATIVIAALTYFIATDGREQMKAIRGQLDAMRDEQRPWISFKDINSEGLIITRDEMYTVVSYHVFNSGHEPAANIRQFFYMTLAKSISDDAKNENENTFDLRKAEDAACIEAKKQNFGYAAFPGESLDGKNYVVKLTRAEFNSKVAPNDQVLAIFYLRVPRLWDC
jgi:hypothetical protein